MTPTIWTGCYADSWKSLIVPAAYQHPAKFAPGLVRRIFEHMLAKGWLRRGETCVDPFGGIAGGGIVGASLGVRWIGVELEQKFVDLGQQNIELHRRKWETFGDPVPVILQGDSRFLRRVLREAGVIGAPAAVGSPPFSGTEQPCASQSQAKKDYHAFTRGDGTKRDALHSGDSPGQLSAMKAGDLDSVVSSPPYADTQVAVDRNFTGSGGGQQTDAAGCERGYGEASGQLGGMREGDIAAVLSSSPYASGSLGHDGAAVRLDAAEDSRRERDGMARRKGYGVTPGQLDAMPDGAEPVADSAVSSPPYEEGLGHGGTKPLPMLVEKKLYSALANNGYGGGPGNISNLAGTTFWEVARDIVRELYCVLKPGAYCAWVLKRYVRAGQIVDFPGQWLTLCQGCGFELVEHVHASLVTETVSGDLFAADGKQTRRSERKSFFRRLHEKKNPATAIDFEEILFLRKI